MEAACPSVPPAPLTAAAAAPDTLYLAARRGDLDAVKRLVEVDGAAINESDSFGNQPLYYAALCGHKAVVEYFLHITTRGSAPGLAEGAVVTTGMTSRDTARTAFNSLNLEIRRMFPRPPSVASSGAASSKSRRPTARASKKKDASARPMTLQGWRAYHVQAAETNLKRRRNCLPTLEEDPAPTAFESGHHAVAYMMEDSDSEGEDEGKKKSRAGPQRAEDRDAMALDVVTNVRHVFGVRISMRQARRLLDWTDWNVDYALTMFLEAGLAEKWAMKDPVVVDPEADPQALEEQWPSLFPTQPPAAPGPSITLRAVAAETNVSSEGEEGWETISARARGYDSDLGVESMSDAGGSTASAYGFYRVGGGDMHSDAASDLGWSVDGDAASYLEAAALSAGDALAFLPAATTAEAVLSRRCPGAALAPGTRPAVSAPAPPATGGGEDEGDRNDLGVDDLYLQRKDPGGRVALGSKLHVVARNIKKGFKVIHDSRPRCTCCRHSPPPSQKIRPTWDASGMNRVTSRYKYGGSVNPKKGCFGPHRANPAERIHSPLPLHPGDSWGYQKKVMDGVVAGEVLDYTHVAYAQDFGGWGYSGWPTSATMRA